MTKAARILIIAGSDSGGGAGIQADIKTVSALGGFAMTVVTAITAQNTLGVHGVQMVSTEMIAAQFNAVIEDIGADIIKIGMLGDADTISCVAKLLQAHPDIPVILDPVMQAKGGASLLQNDAAQALKELLLPLATVITPNIPEAETLCDTTIASQQDREQACKMLCEQSGASIVLKGGHGEGETLRDILYHHDKFYYYDTERIDTLHTHGTGCTFASALATFMAKNIPLSDAVKQAQQYVRQAILCAPQLGAGHGPLWHQIS